YYNPYLCRFINPDPSGFAGGLNWYAYADGNPVSLLDPFGLGAISDQSGGYSVASTLRAPLGWAYDQIYSTGALLAGLGSDAIGTGLNMLGENFGNPTLGSGFQNASQYYYHNQLPAAEAGWYDAAHP